MAYWKEHNFQVRQISFLTLILLLTLTNKWLGISDLISLAFWFFRGFHFCLRRIWGGLKEETDVCHPAWSLIHIQCPLVKHAYCVSLAQSRNSIIIIICGWLGECMPAKCELDVPSPHHQFQTHSIYKIFTIVTIMCTKFHECEWFKIVSGGLPWRSSG